MTDREHGTRAKYVRDKCRCEPCKAANRTAENNRYRQQAYGRWEPYADARPVRAHVQTLMDSGLGGKRIAALAGVSHGVVERLLYGAPCKGQEPSSGLLPEHATKLLAVPMPQGASGGAVTVDATGTRRRAQALVAAGWPQAQLAARLGRSPRNFWVSVTRQRIEVATERAVRKLYDQLWRADPAGNGVTANAITRARNHATAHGWAPVGCWDDDTIDNPDAFPDWTGKCGTPRGYRIHHDIGVPLCEPCRLANNTARRAAYAAETAPQAA